MVAAFKRLASWRWLPAALAVAASFGVLAGPAQADPTPSTAPEITGTGQQGQMLTLTPGTWTSTGTGLTQSEQWYDCTGTSASSCTVAITGQTGDSYTLQPADLGEYVAVVETATDSTGTAIQTSNLIGPISSPPPPAPMNTGAPAITGTAQQDQTLSFTPGAWTPSGVTQSEQWYDCTSSTASSCTTAISEQTGNSLVLSSADVGDYVAVIETASNSTATVTATSNLIGPITAVPPTNSKAPVLSPLTVPIGQTLTLTPGTWSNATTVTDTWLECAGATCTALTPTTPTTFTVSATNVTAGDTIEVEETASDGSVSGTPVYTAATAAVTEVPTNSVAPAAPTGITWQGQTLTAQTGTWSPAPTSYTYQWEECTTTCTAITGQTAATMVVPTTVPAGDTIEVLVAGVDAGGTGTAVASAPTAAITVALTNVNPPGWSGTAQVGQTLKETNAVWSLTSPTLTYQWWRCSVGCAMITGATAQTYMPVAADVGAQLYVVETAGSGGGSVSAASPRTPAVTNAAGIVPVPVEQSPPALSGTSQEGQTLDASQGTWTNNPSSFAYQWMRCDGVSCDAVPGASGPTYTPSGNDVGDQMTVDVTAGNAGGNSTAVSSARSGVVMGTSSVSLVATPGSPVTDQGVTLVATVASGAAIAQTTGTITFDNGNTPITGCSNVSVPAKQSAIITCQASFAAGTAQLSAAFSPAKGSLLLGSSSSTSLGVGEATTEVSLLVGSVHLGTATKYTATVNPPTNSPGSILPSGHIEFLDTGVPISNCKSQALIKGVATCSVTYTRLRKHHVTARYTGDSNFNPSNSQTQLVKPGSTPATGIVRARMSWTFHYHPTYTTILSLTIAGLLPGVNVKMNCLGAGCPFTHSKAATKNARCGKHDKGKCSTGTADLTPRFGNSRLRIGAQLTILLSHPNWIGKYYRFTIRPRQAPKDRVSCLAVNSTLPGLGC